MAQYCVGKSWTFCCYDLPHSFSLHYFCSANVFCSRLFSTASLVSCFSLFFDSWYSLEQLLGRVFGVEDTFVFGALVDTIVLCVPLRETQRFLYRSEPRLACFLPHYVARMNLSPQFSVLYWFVLFCEGSGSGWSTSIPANAWQRWRATASWPRA